MTTQGIMDLGSNTSPSCDYCDILVEKQNQNTLCLPWHIQH